MAVQPPQRFELDDLAHVEREARTIYAPGATPGDVLVVQSDHSLVTAPGGGSVPQGVLGSADFLFTEEATAGVYTASFTIPARTTLLDMLARPLALWAADAVDFLVQDSGARVYVNHDDLTTKQLPDYDNDNPATGTNYLNFQGDTVNAGNWGLTNSGNLQLNGPGVYYPTADALTMTVDTTGMSNGPVSPTGVWLVKILYFAPVTATAAVFA